MNNSVARFTIDRAAEMSPELRKSIADWLRRHAKELIKHGSDYSTRFTGRYIVSEK